MSVGCIGLGNMGSELATNLVAAGHDVVTYDLAGAARSPRGATFVADIAAVAARCAVVALSLPDGNSSQDVARRLADAPGRRVTHVVDTSTIGLDWARAIDALLEREGISYVDAPVSGGPAGARARTLTIMYAADDAACETVEPVLAGLSDIRFHVGARPGMGQAMKLANNFLSATALAATSEAIAFGTSVGLDMGTMLDVLNASSGRSTATSDKFVNHVVTGRYASGFANTLMAKDVELYRRAAGSQGTPHVFGDVTADVWQRFAEAEHGVDFTRIYTFAAGTS
jgi:3-hydroxyisobutyrate dehydrogenase-like beta-hydroxyacid dehydrogenase